MTSELESRLIFIDTSAYENKNYQFTQHALKQLRDYLESDKLHLLTTQITNNEVKAHLKEKSEESARLIKRIQKDAMFLRNTPQLPCHGIFERVSWEDIYSISHEQFEEFLNKAGAEIVSIDKVDATKVFDSYFSSTAPFGGANKKSEFPDAFVLEAIDQISKERGHHLYVISSDGDMKRFAESRENMIHLNKVDELLDLIARKEDELKKPVEYADSIFEQLEEQIIQRANEIISSSEFYSDFANEFDDEIYKVEIETLNIKHKNIISVSEENVEYEVDFEVNVKAHYSIADYERSPWDPEDRVYMFVLKNEIVRSHKEVFSAYIYIDYMDGIRANASIEAFDFAESSLELTDEDSEVINVSYLDINGE